jgi:hypothetical protein
MDNSVMANRMRTIKGRLTHNLIIKFEYQIRLVTSTLEETTDKNGKTARMMLVCGEVKVQR